ncbi:phosphoadenosine phosphosulfate reductase family protein [Paenibacillus sp. MBLB2552]|uniref:Phosphoadenosine phosphosulfate reductase family protein n=1 Tax=Paenibacillus mellifer TaxID=2937794 RepID=A0A9X2BR71_9BACL|nr:phosphoadenosine phosphosulfate reductase family protein [Paenibacillus mellifer]MCK8487010.1 phosphoadenosine phosphosulfate reductase family protein [Paenibacillus mellifer]
MNRKIKHVAMFSGGAASAYVAYLMVQKHGKENSVLFFTDTLWEHPDNYRFMYDVADYIGIDFNHVQDEDLRTPEDVFIETRFLGNSRLAKCSSELKVKQTVVYIEKLRDEGYEPILYFGIGPHEKHRQQNLTELYAHHALEPVETRFPLIDANIKDINLKEVIENEWKIKLPEMYYLGFSHANCGGRCVRGGLNHYEHLFKTWPEVYKKQEEMEEKLREMLGNVTILKRNSQPLALKEFREEIESGQRLRSSDITEEDEVPCVCVFS